MKFEMITFAEGNPRWSASANRLLREARSSNFFSKVTRVRLQDFSSYTQVSALVESKFLDKTTRGFGYWAWKPFAIKHALENLDQTSAGVVYIDAGCSINAGTPSARSRMKEYFKIAELEPLFFELPGHPEKFWTKRSAIEAVAGVSQASLESNQLVGGISFWPNTYKSQQILATWIDLVSQDSNKLLLDSLDSTGELEFFRAHRHDQSLMSLSAKKHGGQAILDETWFQDGWVGEATNYPIWATRLKSSVSLKHSGPFGSALRKIEDLIFKTLELVTQRS